MWQPWSAHRKPVSLRRSVRSTRANLNLPQPVGSGIKPSPLGYTLAALDPGNTEITGSIRERILRESALLYAPPEGAGPWVDRSRKGDQLTSTPRGNDNVAAKGDRLVAPPVQQAEAGAAPTVEAPMQQVAVAPSVDAIAEVPAPLDLEAEHVVAAEKQLADAAEEAAQMQLVELPASRDAEPKQPQAEKSTPTRRAQSTKRSQRFALAEREEQRRAERIARDARQKAEKLARSQDAPKASAKLARTPDAKPRSETAEYARPVSPAQSESDQASQSEAHAQPVEATPAKGFVLASAGDYRIGVETRQFERLTAPAAATASPNEAGNSVEAEVAKGKAAALNATIASTAAEGTPSQRTSKLFFGADPMGKKVDGIEPWTPGTEPKLGGRATGNVATGTDATKDVGVKLAALPPVESVTDIPAMLQPSPSERAVMPSSNPDQSVGKDPNQQGGQSIAPKGEVTGADQRPMTPAERLGLSDEKSRAKTVKCLTEVIYFEARGEVVRGQMAVAQVVLNRAFSGKYPNTVCGVVYQNAHRHLACQFTFACDGIADKVKEPDMWERAVVIANEMLDGKIWLPEVGKATHYHAHWVHPGWVREMNKLHRVGVHTFYRPRNWGDGTNAPQWGDVGETQEVAKKLVEVAKKP